jgi:hypothetical protein
MSVLSYLQGRAASAVLSSAERSSIAISISSLQTRLWRYFPTELESHFLFGSYTRDTILPRSMDEYSDVDYMVVFNDSSFTPQTYLDRLRRFVDTYYTRSEIYQSSPTIVLDLNHIRFELVPAIRRQWWEGAGYKIPDGSGGWQDTDPNDFNKSLEDANKRHGYLVKPTIRLAKFWNAENGYPLDSFIFEQWIMSRWFSLCTNQRDFLFTTFDDLNASDFSEQWKRNKIERAKKVVSQVRQYERDNMPATAEIEVKKLIPT